MPVTLLQTRSPHARSTASSFGGCLPMLICFERKVLMSNKPNKHTLPQEITGGTLGFLVGELSAAVTHCKVAPCFGLRRRCLSFCFLLQLTASNAFSMCLPLKILHSYCLNYQVCYDASNWGSIRMLLYLELFGSSDTTVALLQDVTTSTLTVPSICL